jgi:ABC-type amino acid transport system permease subunit
MDFIYKNLIMDGAHKLILFGLGVTMLITVVVLLIGTFAGAILCALSRSRYRVLQGISRGYILILGGTPALLFLMFF